MDSHAVLFYSANARDRVGAKRRGGCIASEVNYSNANARDQAHAKHVPVRLIVSVNTAYSVVVLVIKIMYYICVEISVERCINRNL